MLSAEIFTQHFYVLKKLRRKRQTFEGAPPLNTAPAQAITTRSLCSYSKIVLKKDKQAQRLQNFFMLNSAKHEICFVYKS